jgi:hypothetical protein
MHGGGGGVVAAGLGVSWDGRENAFGSGGVGGGSGGVRGGSGSGEVVEELLIPFREETDSRHHFRTQAQKDAYR